MKLFAVVGGWNYEGYDTPVGIYSSREKAEVALKEVKAGYDERGIVEYELDGPPETLRCPT